MLAEQKKKGEVFQAAMLRAEASRVSSAPRPRRGTVRHRCRGRLQPPPRAHEEIVKIDADGKGGLKEKYEAKVKEIAESREIDSEAQAMNELIGPLMQEGKGKEAIAKLDEIVKAPKSKAQHQLALFFKGMVTMDVDGNAKNAIEALEAGKAVLPNSPVAKRIEQILPELKKQLEEKKEGGDKEGGK